MSTMILVVAVKLIKLVPALISFSSPNFWPITALGPLGSAPSYWPRLSILQIAILSSDHVILLRA
jgi:hypothetical protein